MLIANEAKQAVRASPRVPRYRLIESTIGGLVEDGELPGGVRLPNDQQIAACFETSKNTVTRALCALRDRGVVDRVQGSGTYVSRREQAGMGRLVFIGSPQRKPRTTDSIFGEVQQQLARLAFDRHRATLEQWHANPGEADWPQSAIKRVLDQGAAGVFMLPPEARWADQERCAAAMDRLRASGTPLVLLDRDLATRPRRSGFDLVSLDNEHAGFTLGRHLWSCGARRVVIATPLPMPNAVTRRVAGLRAGLAEDAGPGEAVVEAVDLDHMDEAMRRVGPDALVGKDDWYAARAMQRAYEMRLRVPDDLMIAGFDDTVLAAEMAVPLTSIRQPMEAIAEAAFELMTWRQAHPDAEPREVLLTGRLMARRSTGAEAGGGAPSIAVD